MSKPVNVPIPGLQWTILFSSGLAIGFVAPKLIADSIRHLLPKVLDALEQQALERADALDPEYTEKKEILGTIIILLITLVTTLIIKKMVIFVTGFIIGVIIRLVTQYALNWEIPYV